MRLVDFGIEATSYFMMGQDLPPMPPPPPQVASVFPVIKADRDDSAYENGGGVATGFNLGFGMEQSYGFKNFEVYGTAYAGAGFDISLYKFQPGTHCAGSESDEFGMNNWYLQGQIYAYLNMNIGAAGKIAGQGFDLKLIEGNAALLLMGKMPKPTYIYGGMHLDANILNLVSVEFDFDFDAGTDCEIVSG